MHTSSDLDIQNCVVAFFQPGDEIDEKQIDTKPQAEDDLNAQLNPDSEDDSELEDDKLSKGGLLIKDMLKQNDESSGDDDEEEMDEDETRSAVLLQGKF